MPVKLYIVLWREIRNTTTMQGEGEEEEKALRDGPSNDGM